MAARVSHSAQPAAGAVCRQGPCSAWRGAGLLWAAPCCRSPPFPRPATPSSAPSQRRKVSVGTPLPPAPRLDLGHLGGAVGFLEWLLRGLSNWGSPRVRGSCVRSTCSLSTSTSFPHEEAHGADRSLLTPSSPETPQAAESHLAFSKHNCLLCFCAVVNGLQHARPPRPSPTPGVYSNSCPSSR